MKYELQKIVLENCKVYNILFESNVLGHILVGGGKTILVPTDEISIVPIAESFGFDGPALVANENSYETVMLNGSPELKPIYEYKVVNLPDYSLNQLET
jgi:hypothetical protein